MKIKTKKQMRLDELIKYVWEKDIEDTDFFSNEELPSCQKVKLHVNPRDFNYGESRKKAGVSLKSHGFVVDDRYTFTVEVEEIVTPATIFNELTEYIYDYNDGHHFTAEHKEANIEMIIDCETHHFKTQAIYCKDTLIWSKEHGIPKSGVLEVRQR